MQIQGEIAYGYYMQDDWFEDHFNYYNGYINTGEYYNYKRCYFRTKPSKPFSVTVGMQMVTEFGGTATSYSYDRDKGKVNAKEDRYDTTWKDFVRAFCVGGWKQSGRCFLSLWQHAWLMGLRGALSAEGQERD